MKKLLLLFLAVLLFSDFLESVNGQQSGKGPKGLYEYGLDLFCDPSSRALNHNIRHATLSCQDVILFDFYLSS